MAITQDKTFDTEMLEQWQRAIARTRPGEPAYVGSIGSGFRRFLKLEFVQCFKEGVG